MLLCLLCLFFTLINRAVNGDGDFGFRLFFEGENCKAQCWDIDILDGKLIIRHVLRSEYIERREEPL